MKSTAAVLYLLLLAGCMSGADESEMLQEGDVVLFWKDGKGVGIQEVYLVLTEVSEVSDLENADICSLIAWIFPGDNGPTLNLSSEDNGVRFLVKTDDDMRLSELVFTVANRMNVGKGVVRNLEFRGDGYLHFTDN